MKNEKPKPPTKQEMKEHLTQMLNNLYLSITNLELMTDDDYSVQKRIIITLRQAFKGGQKHEKK